MRRANRFDNDLPDLATRISGGQGVINRAGAPTASRSIAAANAAHGPSAITDTRIRCRTYRAHGRAIVNRNGACVGTNVGPWPAIRAIMAGCRGTGGARAAPSKEPKMGEGEAEFRVDMPVVVYPGSDPEKHGIVV